MRISLVRFVSGGLPCPGARRATFPGADGKIAFVRSGDIWTMNPDGFEPGGYHAPPPLQDSPAWSAHGRQIAYVETGPIWTMNANGALQTQVVPAPSYVRMQPLSSRRARRSGVVANGSKIVFHKFTCTRDPDGGELPSFDLYTVNPDGTGQTLLVTEGMGPRWSPGGTRIGYTGYCFGGGCTDVRWVTADGSSEFTVYQNDLTSDNFVDWSPDGLLLAGSGDRPNAPLFESYTIHPDGTGYTVLPNGVGSWSPDGTKFVQGGVYVQNVDGSNRTQIASSGTSPDWQPIHPSYPRPRGASPLRVSLVPAYQACTAPNRTHGSPLSFPSQCVVATYWFRSCVLLRPTAPRAASERLRPDPHPQRPPGTPPPGGRHRVHVRRGPSRAVRGLLRGRRVAHRSRLLRGRGGRPSRSSTSSPGIVVKAATPGRLSPPPS